MDGIVGCADRFISQFLCGLSFGIKHADVTTAGVLTDLSYPVS